MEKNLRFLLVSSLLCGVAVQGEIAAQNVGIGTVTPEARLHVVQPNSALAFRVDDEPSDPTPLVVLEDGNVGIGLEAPTGKFHVRVEGSSSGGVDQIGNGTNGTSFPNGTCCSPSQPITSFRQTYVAGLSGDLTEVILLGGASGGTGAVYEIRLYNGLVPSGGTPVAVSSSIMMTSTALQTLTFTFPTLPPQMAGQTYTFELTRLTAGPEAIFVRSGFPDPYPPGQVYLNGNPVNLDVNFQTVVTSTTATQDAFFVSATDAHVGVWTTSPTVPFQVGTNGDGTVALANAWTTFSDRRWKANILPIADPRSQLAQLSGYTYTWRAHPDADPQVGLIAQEVRTVFPALVHESAEGYLSVDYAKLTPLLLEAHKALQAEVDVLRSEINALQQLLGNTNRRIKQWKNEP